MTLREMMKKIETYNKLSDEFGKDEKVNLYLDEDDFYIGKFRTYKELKKYFTDTYVKDFANRILESKDFESGKKVEFNYFTVSGISEKTVLKITVE